MDMRLKPDNTARFGYLTDIYLRTIMQDDTPRSDKFYHWGALPGFIGLIESGYY
jgi:hypothetical protein